MENYTFRNSLQDLFCKIVVSEIRTYVINFSQYFNILSIKTIMKNAFSELLKVFTRHFANNKIENKTKHKTPPKKPLFQLFWNLTDIFRARILQ